MTESGRSAGSSRGRRAKRFLWSSQKYEIWLALVRGELSTADAAERAGADRATSVQLRHVAKQGALGLAEAVAADLREINGRPQADASCHILGPTKRHEAVSLLGPATHCGHKLHVIALQPARNRRSDILCFDHRSQHAADPWV